MKEEMQEILSSNKNKTIKFVSIAYLFIGIIALFISVCYAIYSKNIFIFFSGLGSFLVLLFFYIMMTSFYETHQMCKFLVSSIYKNEIDKQEIEDIDKRKKEQANEEELSKLIEKLEK